MAESIKIEQEELKKFYELKDEIQKYTFELGVLYLEKMEMDVLIKSMSDKETELRNKVGMFKKKESELMDSFLKTHGEGSLNIKDGTFTPS